ncbi:unnamed protein product [Lupinus luteus]|uniref:Uncharacterized protein n=1 Tax=Lupinus luteus TaxID=3873 RepID=A0AAV1WN55_LUPLU
MPHSFHRGINSNDEGGVYVGDTDGGGNDGAINMEVAFESYEDVKEGVQVCEEVAPLVPYFNACTHVGMDCIEGVGSHAMASCDSNVGNFVVDSVSLTACASYHAGKEVCGPGFGVLDVIGSAMEGVGKRVTPKFVEVGCKSSHKVGEVYGFHNEKLVENSGDVDRNEDKTFENVVEEDQSEISVLLKFIVLICNMVTRKKVKDDGVGCQK